MTADQLPQADLLGLGESFRRQVAAIVSEVEVQASRGDALGATTKADQLQAILDAATLALAAFVTP